ncbi:MAG: pilus assembly protein PilM [Clostridiales bacterium]|nr:pilus assembly protein PilM [Clostridiales bacterium]
MKEIRFKEILLSKYENIKEYFKKFKLTPNNINKKILVIDIGSHSTKGIVGKYENNKISILNNFKISTPPNIYMDGKINDLLEIKECLKRALQENEINIKSTICTIESSFVISREITLPLINKSDLEDMIYFEIAQYMPIELEKYVIQYKFLENFIEDEIEKIRILAVALPREIASDIFELLEFLDLTPIALDLHSNGINKLINSSFHINNMNNKDTIAILDLGHSHINVIIVEEGIYKFSRIIDLNEIDLNIISSNHLGLGLDNLQNISSVLDEIASANDLEDKSIYNNLSEINIHNIKFNIDTWIEQINHVFKYYTSRNPTNVINNIFIYGGRANIKGLEEYMSNAFNIPTFKIKNIDNIDFINSQINEKDIVDYVNAIAALIRK